MTDWYTDEIFGGIENATDVTFPVSRLVVDPERFEDDNHEPMFEVGMGAIYTQTSLKTPLRRTLSTGESDSLINHYYRPHHDLLTEQTRAGLDSQGSCLILDCHSFPRHPLPYELNPDAERPHICIGTDDYHTPNILTEIAVELFEGQGLSVTLNTPFSGAIVPLKYHRNDKRVLALMIEVRRDLYIDEITAEKKSDFKLLQTKVRSVVSQLMVVTGVLNNQLMC